ncbi:hypothetical protein B0T36_11915 [Nocardia donostiensis]|uniref:HXXEE domain-containing protein n=1 Tax=Nocardia donostiensis TaxID=1538463 RepID=UPI0009DA8B54|nr:HXXEE domain-containing protein [Nocardia donostiensis]OQS14780.1 hypothetical protein B0T36_11915 [Nocardia donostiensis]
MGPKTVALGLFGAWLVNDAEEWFTMGPWSRNRAEGGAKPGWLPVPPWLRRGVSDEHAHIAIGLVGVVMAAAAADGVRTDGRSPFFQSVVTAFGLHGFAHLALSAAARGYTPGVVTAPTVVIPYYWWARRELGRAGIRRDDRGLTVSAVASTAAVLGMAHGAAALLSRR